MEVKTVYDVRDFGAEGDGGTLDTRAVQDAIDTCSCNGGGVVYFPSGYRFLTGTIYLKSHITIHVAENSEILGSRNPADYGNDTGFCPYFPEPLDPCLIFAEGQTGISFTGRGMIDGQFEEDFTSQHDDPLNHDSVQRPMLIRLTGCRNILMENLTLRGAFSWCVHIKYCSNVKLHAMTVLNDRQDGFNIESSQIITISDCTLNCGDDGITLTTSYRDKPLSKGNFERIVMSNCVLKDCGGGGIKIGMFEGAVVRNCIFSGIVMENVTAPILVMNARWTDIGSRDSEPRMMPAGEISDMHEIDIDKHDYWTDDKTIWGIPVSSAVFARHLKSLQIQDMNITHRRSEVRPAFAFADCSSIRLRDNLLDDKELSSGDILKRNQ